MKELNINNLIERNKQLEKENKLLKDRILTNILSENTEIVRLNFIVLELKRKLKSVSDDNNRLKLFV